MKRKLNYRCIPINVHFAPQKKSMKKMKNEDVDDVDGTTNHNTFSTSLVWKNEYEIRCRPYYNDDPQLQQQHKQQCHFLVHPFWLHFGLMDEEGMGSLIDKEGWIGVYTPTGRRFSSPKHIHSIKTLLRALAYLYQNPNRYLRMDTMTRVLSVCCDDDDNEHYNNYNDKEINIYRLRINQ
jgi:hypothetical protein